MRAQVCRLAIGLLLAHATLGCGWCHAHLNVPLAGAIVFNEDGCSDSHGGCCDSHGVVPYHPTHNTPAEPCPGHVDCQVRCIYVQPDRVQLDEQQQVPCPLDGAIAGETHFADLGSAQVVVHRRDGPLQLISLRRHLVFQLLLI